MRSFSDTNSEVTNQALKCVGPLANRIPPETAAPYIDRMAALTSMPEIDASIPNTGLRSLVAALPQPSLAGLVTKEAQEAYKSISKVLIPRLVGEAVFPDHKKPPGQPAGLLESHPDKGYSADAVEVLIEVVRCYGNLLHELELSALAKSVMAIIEDEQAGGVVKKRALAAIGVLLVHFSNAQLSGFVSVLIESFKSSYLTPTHRKYLIATIGTLARATPAKFGPYIKSLAPFVLSAISQQEIDETQQNSDYEGEIDPEVEELRETALISMEAMLGSCRHEMQEYIDESVEASVRYLKYDPNMAISDDEDMGGTQDDNSDDGFTEEAEDDDDEYADLDDDGAFSDVDDVSWKARRCAAKALYTIISGASSANRGLLFERIAPILIGRLNSEREENVKLEVISALNALVRKTGSPNVASPSYTNGMYETLANTRKRRRQDSDASLSDLELSGYALQGRATPPVFVSSSPPTGLQGDLSGLVPKITQSLIKLWKKASIALKQAAITLLRSLALTRNGALAEHLQSIEDPIADALKPASSTLGMSAASAAPATAASLQIETLLLVSTITETNTTSTLLPFVIALIPAVTDGVQDKNLKVSSEALAAIEQFVKALTPPRLPSSGSDHAMHVEKLYEVVKDRIIDNNADLEVRHRAIQVIGILIARTSPTKLLRQDARTTGLGIILDRLRNETTRLASARAVATIAAAAVPGSILTTMWVQEASIEIAQQLRKSDRALRGSCLDALKNLALNPVTAEQYDTKTIEEIQSLLLPLFSTSDLHLLTPALVILARIIPTNPQQLVNQELVNALSLVVKTQLIGTALRALLFLVKTVAESGAGAPVLKGFLAVGTAGEITVLGRSIGTLVAFGGPNIGCTAATFLNELQTPQQPENQALALAVLGEIGLRQGSASPLTPQIFIQVMASESERVSHSAALALGSAGAGNVDQYLPVILQNLGKGSQDYLYLQAVKEILQHPENIIKALIPYADQLWQALFSACQIEDNQAIAAECIGRLALVNPTAYIPELQTYLQAPKKEVRGAAITAFRFTLGDSSESYNNLLKTVITPVLRTMLGDDDIGNRRLAVTTLNSAIHNRPDLVMPDMPILLPIVLADSHIKPVLIKQVQFGPFKINVDDGLDLRKSCYETLYALLDTSSVLNVLSSSTVFDRIIDGVSDDHDVRTLCNLMLGKLTYIDPDETRRRLGPLAEKFKIVLSTKLKETAVKQEIEKVNEANAAVIRTSLDLDKNFPGAATDSSDVGWKAYLDWVKKDFAGVVRSIQEES